MDVLVEEPNDARNQKSGYHHHVDCNPEPVREVIVIRQLPLPKHFFFCWFYSIVYKLYTYLFHPPSSYFKFSTNIYLSVRIFYSNQSILPFLLAISRLLRFLLFLLLTTLGLFFLLLLLPLALSCDVRLENLLPLWVPWADVPAQAIPSVTFAFACASINEAGQILWTYLN